MKFKIILFMILVVAFTIFVSQNTLVIPVNIFVWQVEMSVIVLMSLSGLLGVIIAFIFLKILEHKDKKRKKDAEPKATKLKDSSGQNLKSY